jgi:putative FmdB family regulatory protein
MPTYDYRCEACEHQFETFQSITAQPLRACPKCRKQKLRRLIGTGAALLFKGDGFYITDYRSESYKKAAEKESGTGASDKPTETAGSKASTNAGSDAGKPASSEPTPPPTKPASPKPPAKAKSK